MFCVSRHIVSENLCVVIVNRHHRFHTFILLYGAKIAIRCAETRLRMRFYLSFISKHLSTVLIKHE